MKGFIVQNPQRSRRGTSIAAAALSFALVAPFAQPIAAPNLSNVAQAAPGQITDSAGRYVPADSGRVYDNGADDGLRYAGLIPEYVDGQSTGTAFVFKVPHWSQSRGYMSGGVSESDPDSNAQFIRFRDKELYSQIARIELVGTNSDAQGTFKKRDPKGSEWTLPLNESKSFPGAAGKDYASYIQIYLNDGKQLSDIGVPESGFAVDYYWLRNDGRVMKNSVQSTLMLSPEQALEKAGLEAESRELYDGAGANNIPSGVANYLYYDQENNTLKSTTTAKLTENFLQSLYSGSWLFSEQLDPKIAPYVKEVTIYNSDVNGNKSNRRKTFAMGFDKDTGLAASKTNPEISFLYDGEKFDNKRFDEVRGNVNDILWGTLGQNRSWTIEYKLDENFLELTNQPEGEYLEALSWIEVDLQDRKVNIGAVDEGKPPRLLKNSVAASYINVVDTDGDGLTDQYERQIGTDSAQADTDGDGIPDGQEVLKDGTDPKKPGSYKPAEPTIAQDKVNINDSDIDVRALRTEYVDSKDGRLIAVTTNGVAPMTVWVVPTDKIGTNEETGEITFDQADAVGRNSMSDRRSYENGAVHIPNLEGLVDGQNYTLLAVSPNGEITKGGNFTATKEQLSDSATPTIDPVTTADRVVTVKAPAGSDVAVTMPTGAVVVASEDPENPGTFTAAVPRSALPLNKGDEITAVATESGKEPSKPVTTKVVAQSASENYGVDYPALVTAEQDTATATPAFTLNGKSVDTLPEGTEFKGDLSKAPEGTTVSFDEKGVATVSVPKQEAGAPAYNFELPVTATIDGEEITDTIVVQVPAGEETPAAENLTVKPIKGQEIWSDDEIDPIKVETDEPLKAPKHELSGAPEGLTINPETGEITGTPKFDKNGADFVTKDGDAVFNVTVKVTDGDSVGTKTFPLIVKDSSRDSDGDGLTDKEELDGSKNNGEPTDPNKSDTDGDGVSDKDEIDAGTDPNDPNSKPGGDTKPADDAVGLDETGKQPVKPTNDEQSTGIKVKNPTKDTKVSAKDEDGKDIPAKLDENGNVVVTPGEDVDGPITVTVDDPSLDSPLVTDVDVEGHQAGRDDNGSDASNKTTVEGADNPKTVKPTGDEQSTGVKVTNPGDDTKVTAKDEDGNTVPATIDPETGEIKVTPGTDVDGPITLTIEDPDLPGGKIEVEVPVDGHKAGRDDNGKETTANVENPTYGESTTVKPGESAQSKKPFGEKEAPEGTTITVTQPKDATDWTFTGDEHGVVTAQAPSNDDLAKQFAKLGTQDWDKVVEALTPVAEPKVGVDFNYADKSTDSATAQFQLVGQDGKSILDPNGDFDGDGVSNKDEVTKGGNPFDSIGVVAEGDGKVPADGKSHVVGKVNNPGAVNKDGKLVDKDGNEIKGSKVHVDPKTGEITVSVPAGTPLGGAKAIISDKDGNKVGEVDVQIANPGLSDDQRNRCIASAVGFGLPLIALLPLGLATQVQIPVLSDVAAQASAQLQDANTRIQQQAGIFNPEMAAQVERINAQLGTVGADLGMVAAGIVLIAAGILAGTIIYDNCNPNGPKSSVKDLELQGSSGKTTKLSSKKGTAAPSPAKPVKEQK